MSKVSVIGLGRMGRGIVRRLASKGHEVSGFDVVKSVYSQLNDVKGFKQLNEVSDSIESDYILLLLPSGDELLKTLPQLKGTEAVVINMTTTGVQDARKAEGLSNDLGIKYITAMIEGGPANAEAGTLVFYVGGDGELYNKASPLLSDLGQHIYVGSNEAATALKLISTMILMANTVILAEVNASLQGLGLSKDNLVRALSMGGADSAQLRARLPMMLSSAYKEVFSVDLGSYVAQEALAAIKSLGSTFTPVLSEVAEVLSAAKNIGLGKKDIAEVAEVYRMLSAHNSRT